MKKILLYLVLLWPLGGGAQHFVRMGDIFEDRTFRFLASGDLDTDGDNDLVFTSVNGNLAWLENTGTGEFEEFHLIQNTLKFYSSPVTADMDNDGDIDIVITARPSEFDIGLNWNVLSQLGWFENKNGEGTFSKFNPISNIENSSFSDFEIVDFDLDDKLDIVTMSNESGELVLFTNKGDGNFQGSHVDSIDQTAYLIASTDLDKDTDLDFVSVSRIETGEFQLSWHEQINPNNFETHILKIYSAISIAPALNVSDFDNDGFDDILLAGYSRVNIIYNDTLKFQEDKTIYTLLANYDALSGDFDNDGDIDFICSGYLYKNNANSKSFEEISLFPNLNETFNHVIDDFDTDSLLEIFSTQYGNDGYDRLDQKVGNNDFELIGSVFPEYFGVYHLADFDGDGDADIEGIQRHGNSRKLVWRENLNGLGDFGEYQFIDYIPNNIEYHLTADISNDGVVDLIVQTGSSDTLFYYSYESASGDFSTKQPVIVIPDSAYWDIVFFDINSDGYKDIIMSDRANIRNISIYYSDSLLNFTLPQELPSTWYYDVIGIIDFDEDGDLDIIASSGTNDPFFRWFENKDGQGDFSSSKSLDLPDGIGPIFMNLNLSKDDYTDFLYYEYIQSSNSLRISSVINENSNDNFEGPFIIGDSVSFNGLQASDIDMDGDLDLIALSNIDDPNNNSYFDCRVWFENLSNGKIFSPKKRIPIIHDSIGYFGANKYPEHGESFIPMDIDGDGATDLLGQGKGQITWYKNIPANAYPISGKVYLDTTLTCTATDTLNTGLNEWIVVAERTDGLKYHALTNEDGNYVLEVDSGEYKVNVILPNSYYYACFYDSMVTVVPSLDTIHLSLPVQVGVECPLLDVNIQTSNLRPCLPAFQSVSYCNSGTATAEDISIEVTFDSLLEVTGSSIPWFSQDGQVYTFNVADLEPGECGSFTIYSLVDCDAPLGHVNCAFANIYPDSLCNFPLLNWDGSNVTVSGECVGDSITFTIQNTGSGNMQMPLDYIIQIVNDDIVIFLQADTFQLDAGEIATINAPSSGLALKMEAEQSLNNPVSGNPIVVVPNCDSLGLDSIFFILNQFPMGNGNPFGDQACLPITGSFDPNDKQAFPSGFGPNHLVEPDWEIEYLIRFQNTGTDTAFTVVVRDTLSPHLNPSTVRSGAASHPYSWDLTGNGVLSFTFDNILLPDSTTNEPLSHGFVSFTIEQETEILPGTVFENTAFIYFDFNDPVMTNTTFHEVVKPVVQEVAFLEFCGETNWNGINITSDTLLVDTTYFVEYDSITLLNVSVHENYLLTFDTLLHQWEMWNGQYFFMDTTLLDSYLTIFNCDSVVLTNVHAIPLTYSELEVMVCEGDEWNGVVYIQDTLLVDTLVSTVEDTIFLTDLTIEETYEISIDTMMPYGEPYFFDTVVVLKLVAANGCDSTLILNVDVTTGTNDLELNGTALTVYPNPSNHFVYCFFKNESPVIKSVSIWSATGKVLESIPLDRAILENTPLVFDLSEFPAGLFLFRFNSEEGFWVKKVLRID